MPATPFPMCTCKWTYCKPLSDTIYDISSNIIIKNCKKIPFPWGWEYIPATLLKKFHWKIIIRPGAIISKLVQGWLFLHKNRYISPVKTILCLFIVKFVFNDYSTRYYTCHSVIHTFTPARRGVFWRTPMLMMAIPIHSGLQWWPSTIAHNPLSCMFFPSLGWWSRCLDEADPQRFWLDVRLIFCLGWVSTSPVLKLFCPCFSCNVQQIVVALY